MRLENCRAALHDRIKPEIQTMDINDTLLQRDPSGPAAGSPQIRHGEGTVLPALKVPVTHFAAERIQRMIIDGAWQVGHRLPGERQLSEQLGVSRVSLRHALSLLETLGFVAIEPGRGAFVLPEERRRVQGRWKLAGRYTAGEVFLTRCMLNGWAAALLAPRIAASELHALTGAVAEMSEAAQRNDLTQLNEWDMRFHDMLFEYCGNKLLADLARTMHKERSDSTQLAFAGADRGAAALDEHRSVIEALQRRDSAAAKEAVERHLCNEAQRAGCDIAKAWALADSTVGETA
jgi:GntR family transcriptional repressor for pyruvate dehydrogenase complex